MKKAYQAPRLAVHGDVEKVTQGLSNGNFTDKQFSRGHAEAAVDLLVNPSGGDHLIAIHKPNNRALVR